MDIIATVTMAMDIMVQSGKKEIVTTIVDRLVCFLIP